MKVVQVTNCTPGMLFGFKCVRPWTFAPPVEGWEPFNLWPGDGLTLSVPESVLGALALSVAKQAVADGYLVPDADEIPKPGRSFNYAEVK